MTKPEGRMTKESPSRPPTDKAKCVFHIVASRFNTHYVDGPINHATEELRALVPNATISLHRVPGSFEIPVSRAKLRSNTKPTRSLRAG